jgi:hypothetical protein
MKHEPDDDESREHQEERHNHRCAMRDIDQGIVPTQEDEE